MNIFFAIVSAVTAGVGYFNHTEGQYKFAALCVTVAVMSALAAICSTIENKKP